MSKDIVMYRVLKEDVWSNIVENCPYGKYQDLRKVGSTYCYKCTHPEQTLKNSMCRAPICKTLEKMRDNPEIYDVITEYDLQQIEIRENIINHIEEIYENNYNRFMATPKGIKEWLVDDTGELWLTLEEIETICNELIENKRLATTTITHNNKEHEILCTVEYNFEKERKQMQKKSNLQEIYNEINRIEQDIQSVTNTFEERRFKFPKIEQYQLISSNDIEKLLKRAKILYEGIKEFKDWFNDWKTKDWCD